MDERFNQTLQNMLIKYIDTKKNLWAQFLDTCIFAYNTSAHESTKFSPFELMFGRKAVLPIDINMGSSDPAAILEEFNHCQELSPSNVQEATELKNTVLEEAKANIAAAQLRQKEHYDRKYSQSGYDQSSDILGLKNIVPNLCTPRCLQGWSKNADERPHTEEKKRW